MGLRIDIDAALAAAQDEGDAVSASALRLVQCAIRDRDRNTITRSGEPGCEDQHIAAILKHMIQQREAEATRYEESGRPEMAEREREEALVLASLLPRTLPETDVRRIAEEVVVELDAHGLKDIGRCVSEVKVRAGAAVDPSCAKAVVRELLDR